MLSFRTLARWAATGTPNSHPDLCHDTSLAKEFLCREVVHTLSSSSSENYQSRSPATCLLKTKHGLSSPINAIPQLGSGPSRGSAKKSGAERTRILIHAFVGARCGCFITRSGGGYLGRCKEHVFPIHFYLKAKNARCVETFLDALDHLLLSHSSVV